MRTYSKMLLTCWFALSISPRNSAWRLWGVCERHTANCCFLSFNLQVLRLCYHCQVCASRWIPVFSNILGNISFNKKLCCSTWLPPAGLMAAESLIVVWIQIVGLVLCRWMLMLDSFCTASSNGVISNFSTRIGSVLLSWMHWMKAVITLLGLFVMKCKYSKILIMHYSHTDQEATNLSLSWKCDV